MTDHANAPDSGDAAEWQRALDDLERSLRDATWAVTVLRRSLESRAPAAPASSAPAPPSEAPPPAAPASPPPGPDANVVRGKGVAGQEAFTRLWDRIETERSENGGDGAGGAKEDRRGLELLPSQYLITVEDREGKVNLVTLHRAILSLDGVDDVSLVSYANGVPVVSLSAETDVDLDQLGGVVGEAMDRKCEVIPQDNGKVYLRMSSLDE